MRGTARRGRRKRQLRTRGDLCPRLHNTKLEHAGRLITAGPLKGTATVIKSSGGPFAEGGNWRIACVVYGRSSEAGIDLEAPCTMTDEPGDKLYLMA